MKKYAMFSDEKLVSFHIDSVSVVPEGALVVSDEEFAVHHSMGPGSIVLRDGVVRLDTEEERAADNEIRLKILLQGMSETERTAWEIRERDPEGWARAETEARMRSIIEAYNRAQ